MTVCQIHQTPGEKEHEQTHAQIQQLNNNVYNLVCLPDSQRWLEKGMLKVPFFSF